jgi:GNAT superfamily N-acetyltransferase
MEIIVRQARDEDFQELVRVDFQTWARRNLEYSTRRVRSVLNIFPQGFICATLDGEMAGSFITMKKKYDINHPVATWVEASAGGLITNHDPEGNALYGVALGVPPQYRGLGIGKKIVERVKRLVEELDLELLAIGARIPFYHKYPDIDVHEYVSKRNENGDRFEPELRFYERCGLAVGTILSESMTGAWADQESRNYGVQMYWINPYFHKSLTDSFSTNMFSEKN